MSNLRRQTTTFVQECKVCKDAGKPEALCRTHRVKDSTGKVICPTLLSQQCLKCGKKGHTVKFCSATAKSCAVVTMTVTATPSSNNKLEKNTTTTRPTRPTTPTTTTKQTKNIFELLKFAGDSFSLVKVKKTEKKKAEGADFENNFPKLCASIKKIKTEDVKPKLSINSFQEQQHQQFTQIIHVCTCETSSISNTCANSYCGVTKNIIYSRFPRELCTPLPTKMQEELQEMKLTMTEKQLKKQMHNHDCFNGRNGMTWADAYDSDDDDDDN